MEILSNKYSLQYDGRPPDKDEVLQPSSLAAYHWPDTDPTEVNQPTRLKTKTDEKDILCASTNVYIDWEMFEKNHRNQGLPEKIFQLLTNSKFQFNTRSKILEEKIWLERIAETVAAGKPICITYPLFCKIGNWAKQMTNVGPNAGEEATILFFRHIDNLVRKLYEPGIKFVIATDAQLYNSAFQNAEVEVTTYMNECRQLIKDRNANTIIDFLNYVDLLAEFPSDYLRAHAHYQKIMRTAPEKILNGIAAKTLFDSVKASINTRKLMMGYIDQKQIFSSQPYEGNKYFKIIDQMTQAAFEEVISIRMACSELNIFEKLFPNNIRVTCHKGLKNGKAVIGLRPYPEYYGSSKLLPYHGVPILTNSKHGLKLDVHPEVMLRGRMDLVRVIDERGHTYYYDGTSLPNNATNISN